jgi:hypothetical protein
VVFNESSEKGAKITKWSNCNRDECVICLYDLSYKVGLVPPRGRANFIFSPSRKRNSHSLYWAASDGVADEGLVECNTVTSNPMRWYGVFQWPVSSEWSRRIDRPNGCSLGNDGTMLWISLEYFDDFITYAIASLGFVVDFTA